MKLPGPKVARGVWRESLIGCDDPSGGTTATDFQPVITPADRPNQSVRRELAKALHWLAPEPRVTCLVPCWWSGFLPTRDPLARLATAQEENDLHEPTHSDLLFAIWTVLALPDPEGDPGIDDEVLSELFDDLHLDLQRVKRHWSDDDIETADEWAGYEELAIALP